MGPENSLSWECPVHYRMFDSILGLHPLDAGSNSPAFHNQECLQILTNVSLRGKVPQTPKGRVQSQRLVFLAPGFSGHLVHPLQFPSQETDQRGQMIYLWSQWRTRLETTWPGRSKTLSIPANQLQGDESGSFICLSNNI